MAINQPPVQEKTSNSLGLFPQTWVLWFDTLRSNINSLFTRVEYLEHRMGWAFYDDSEYTEVSPLNVNNASVQLTIDEQGSSNLTGYLPNNTSFFSNDKITPENVGDTYALRLDFKAKGSTPSDKFDVFIDIGGSNPIIFDQSVEINKGSGVEQRYNLSIVVFSLNTFVANGGAIYLDTTETGDNIDFYDFGLLITRVGSPID